MTSLEPRPPYTSEELEKLYPSRLQLKLVQVILRHGERTPVSARFQDEGVPAYWPYCKSAAHFRSAVLNASPGAAKFTQLAFRRLIEANGENGAAVVVRGPHGTADDICLLGELTDKGRTTTLELGERLQALYGDRLGFLPKDLSDPSQFYFRASPILRSLTSLQQVLVGMYPDPPPHPPITILARSPPAENLFPNEVNCRRFSQLARQFATLACNKWNNHEDMEYLQSRIGKYLSPEHPRIAIDGHPRLSGIMDTVNSTLAHGPDVRLPAEFYEPRVREIMNRINVDEWFRGYIQSSEYRKLGSGSLLGNFRDRMVQSAKGESPLRIALYGSHDTTLAALLSTLGAFDGQWPPYTSSIAFELFQDTKPDSAAPPPAAEKNSWTSWFGYGLTPTTTAAQLHNHYVRLRYNDAPLTLPQCKPIGKHLPGDESFCTLAAFKEIVDKIAPADWHAECLKNLDKDGIPPVELVE
ncbi:histidine phosphatase superfamily [Peziza echinospora]|nr:histidine phosphatase superfamily [Peziza echinospora]